MATLANCHMAAMESLVHRTDPKLYKQLLALRPVVSGHHLLDPALSRYHRAGIPEIPSIPNDRAWRARPHILRRRVHASAERELPIPYSSKPSVVKPAGFHEPFPTPEEKHKRGVSNMPTTTGQHNCLFIIDQGILIDSRATLESPIPE